MEFTYKDMNLENCSKKMEFTPMLGGSHIFERDINYSSLKNKRKLVQILNLFFKKFDTLVDFQIIVKIRIFNF
jgi:hypothetical protein